MGHFIFVDKNYCPTLGGLIIQVDACHKNAIFVFLCKSGWCKGKSFKELFNFIHSINY